MAEGLVRSEGFAIDASVVKADANRQRGVPSTDGLDLEGGQLARQGLEPEADRVLIVRVVVPPSGEQ
jgi:hypothetical protein